MPILQLFQSCTLKPVSLNLFYSLFNLLLNYYFRYNLQYILSADMFDRLNTTVDNSYKITVK